uniref:Myosin binding protein C2 n=1 Tax=Gopherus evgoodei TaxID=1825980 RepID=A0A8C5F0F3_9SAUR
QNLEPWPPPPISQTRRVTTSCSPAPAPPSAPPPSFPTHLTLEDVTDTTATLKWRPPDRLGAGGIDGYLVQYCLEGSDEWVPANTELVERCGFTVKGLPTGQKILFRVIGVNIAGQSAPATMGQPVTIREIVEQPKIRLPRQLRQTYIKKVGEQVNLLIPFQGKPRPKVTWMKDGRPLDPKEVSIRTSDLDTILFIRSAARHHSGQYQLSVQIENMEDQATIQIRVVEKPGPPVAVQVKEVWGFNVLLEWQPPKDDGNSEITGYTIQKADKKTMEWFTVYEHNRLTRCTISDLVMGNEYSFRVYSQNICGLSDTPGVSKNTALIQKTGIIFKPLDYQEHDFRMAPRVLTPLIDRTVVAGYSTALNCAVRGHPKPKVIWMKNHVEIREDPKFLMKNSQGVLTLHIRKPSPFDAGTYSCLAVNELGEALTECKLDVRGAGGQGAGEPGPGAGWRSEVPLGGGQGGSAQAGDQRCRWAGGRGQGGSAQAGCQRCCWAGGRGARAWRRLEIRGAAGQGAGGPGPGAGWRSEVPLGGGLSAGWRSEVPLGGGQGGSAQAGCQRCRWVGGRGARAWRRLEIRGAAGRGAQHRLELRGAAGRGAGGPGSGADWTSEVPLGRG